MSNVQRIGTHIVVVDSGRGKLDDGPAPPRGNEFGGRGSEASGTRGGHVDTTSNSASRGGHAAGGGWGNHGGSGNGKKTTSTST